MPLKAEGVGSSMLLKSGAWDGEPQARPEQRTAPACRHRGIMSSPKKRNGILSPTYFPLQREEERGF